MPERNYDKVINEGSRCPNCQSVNFVETARREHCPDCGLECDYHGNGANQVYKDMMARRNAQQEQTAQTQESQWD